MTGLTPRVDKSEAQQGAAAGAVALLVVAVVLAVWVLSCTTTPEPAGGATWTSPVDGMVQVYVPAGEFLMGSTDADTEANSDEKPQHTVYVDALWIDRTEVTADQYAKCVAAGKCAQPSSGAGKGDYPVAFVVWQDAADYCAWAGRRLPTEAEWEKAARGTDGRKYPWGNGAPDCDKLNDWGGQDGFVAGLAAVGSCPAATSPYGALDMASNVWEWVADWYDAGYYGKSANRNPTGPDSGNARVFRGGSFTPYQGYIRVATRLHRNPVAHAEVLGIRCARSP